MPVKNPVGLIADICMRGLLVREYKKEVDRKDRDPKKMQSLVKQLNKIEHDCKALTKSLECLED